MSQGDGEGENERGDEGETEAPRPMPMPMPMLMLMQGRGCEAGVRPRRRHPRLCGRAHAVVALDAVVDTTATVSSSIPYLKPRRRAVSESAASTAVPATPGSATVVSLDEPFAGKLG